MHVPPLTAEQLARMIQGNTQCVAELLDPKSDIAQLIPQRVPSMLQRAQENLAAALELQRYRDKHGPLGESELEAPDLTFIAHRRGNAPR